MRRRGHLQGPFLAARSGCGRGRAGAAAGCRRGRAGWPAAGVPRKPTRPGRGAEAMSVRDDDRRMPAPRSDGEGFAEPLAAGPEPVGAADAGRGGIARRRRRTVVLGVLVLIAVAGVSWWAGRATTTTTKLARAAAPPKAPVLTAPVVLKRLGTTVQAGGKLVAADTETIDVGSITVPNAESIVTADVVHVGETIGDGTVIAQVAGRPVFAFAGGTPMYRSLQYGDSGADVTELQQDLAALGYSIIDTSGTYGLSTSAALSALYRNAGYAPPPSAPIPGVRRKPPQAILEPQAEIVFLPKLPATVAASKEPLGKAIGSPAVTLTYGSVVVNATLTVAQGYLIEPGDHATVSVGSGRPLAGAVRYVKRSVQSPKAKI